MYRGQEAVKCRWRGVLPDEKKRAIAARRANSQQRRERRRWQRLPLGVPIFARGVDDHGKEFLEFTSTLNLSAGGTLLAMRRPIAPSTEVLLEIPAAPLPKISQAPEFIRRLPATVLRVSPSESAYLWALRFQRRIPLG